MNQFPEKFIERLKKIIPSHQYDGVYECLLNKPKASFRNNSLSQGHEETFKKVRESGVAFDEISWYQDAIMLKEDMLPSFMESDLVKQGILYKQGLSSMIIPLILNPECGESILDCCAAPGSKTTQLVALTKNQSSIVAIENIRNRFYKLKSVCSLLGVQNVMFKFVDARKFRAEQRFDKILVDAPCSSEGRFCLSYKKTYAYWSERKIREMQRKQKGIVLNASRLLRVGGELVYSTCTFSPEENEGVVDWLLRKSPEALEVQLIEMEDVSSYPCLHQWKNKIYNSQVKKCLRILPSKSFEGFFACKIKKIGM